MKLTSNLNGGYWCRVCNANDCVHSKRPQINFDYLLNSQQWFIYPPKGNMKLNASSPRQGVRGAKIPSRTIREEYLGSRHNLECQSSLSNEIYDPNCFRCTKIKKVISLRRKQVKYGASLEEANASYSLAAKIIDDYELTRGETFDKKYTDVAIPPSPKPKVTRRKATDELTDEDFEQVI